MTDNSSRHVPPPPADRHRPAVPADDADALRVLLDDPMAGALERLLAGWPAEPGDDRLLDAVLYGMRVRRRARDKRRRQRERDVAQSRRQNGLAR